VDQFTQVKGDRLNWVIFSGLEGDAEERHRVRRERKEGFQLPLREPVHVLDRLSCGRKAVEESGGEKRAKITRWV
jgi:hypothetical protein